VEALDQVIPALSQLPKWACQPGAQPIPGYRLIEPLGRGGFGEVWKCEAPGGLFKAVKFVPSQEDQAGPANQEQEALQRVKTIRHPFILSLERVEVVEGVLVIIMELADKSLHGLLGEYQSKNLPGIPREELLGYLLEAAEALDWMNFGHGLQHLDIKPHNLFLISNHLKVADFGLVDRLSDTEKSNPTQRQGGVTPLYAAPELLSGTVSRHCDQYSLAIVYQQLLTGMLPFWSRNMYHLMMLHMTGQPNLTPLPVEDRPVVARALSKRAEDRYPSCLDFLQALVCGEGSVKVDLQHRAATVKKLVSDLKATEKPTKSVRRVSAPTLTAESRRPPAGPASPTVPAGTDQESSLPLDCTFASVPRRANTASSATMPTGTENGSPTKDGTPATVPHPALASEFAPAQTRPATASVSSPSLPGYRFLQCLHQTPLGDVWRVEDEQGQRRRALCLPVCAAQDPSLPERLGRLLHPALPAMEVVWSPSGQFVLITEEYPPSLRDHLEACQKRGLPGIPRDELLGYLHAAAEVLDTLYERHGLPHLGLNPRTLVLHQESVWLTDFGLVPLVWLPTGQLVGTLNGRYAAPELFEKTDPSALPPGQPAWSAVLGRAGPASDQYSLALIYAEMLNGMPPRSPRSGSGFHRRPGLPPARKFGRGDGGVVAASKLPRIDMDLVPACDREVLRRALHSDPEQRFASCTDLVEALRAAAVHKVRPEDLYHRLPAVIPFPSLQGEPPPQDIVLPAVRELVLDLAAPVLAALGPGRNVNGPQNVRFMQSSDAWECKCPIQLFSGGLALKVEGFRSEWQASTVHESATSYVLQIDLQTPSRPEDRGEGSLIRVAVELDVQSAMASTKHYAEARMRVRPAGENAERAVSLLPELAPRLFDSMRSYLQASPDQRREDRWQCPQPLHVYPVMPSLELEEVLEGISRNISLGGVSFRVSKPPRAEQAYLHWHKSASVSRFAVLVRIIRVQPMAGGGFEVGACFPGASK
jgi:serine/threonine protein kinase